MKKLDLNLCPISDEQLEREFINIFEQLTGLKFKCISGKIDYTRFCFKMIGNKITKETIEILDNIDGSYCRFDFAIPNVFIDIKTEWRYGSRKMYLYQVIGDLLFDYVRAVEDELEDEEELEDE